MMLNMQSTIIVLSDGADLTFINQTGLDFFDFEDSDQFLNILRVYVMPLSILRVAFIQILMTKVENG